MKNRFNNLTSKEWLPFQKSWFLHNDFRETYRKNLRFFLKFDHEEFEPTVYFEGSEEKTEIISELADELGIGVFGQDNLPKKIKFQFVLIDLLDQEWKSIKEFEVFKDDLLNRIEKIKDRIVHRRFLAIVSNNRFVDQKYCAFTWQLSAEIAQILTLKDEKIACLEPWDSKTINDVYSPILNHFYISYFRFDELTGTENQLYKEPDFYKQILQEPKQFNQEESLNSWHILKPKRRNKKEILHPAKYPEKLVHLFLPLFTNEGDNVFDPMSGTASTQLAALMMDRNGFGTELSPFFSELAIERLSNFINPEQKVLFEKDRKHLKFKILNKDARAIKLDDFPMIDYLITSPPYWNMLNMAGAENQAKRRDKGLKLNYSEDERDLGNILDYQEFMDELCKIYDHLYKIVKPGGYMTIVVKNIKKKGRNYPFAYDLAHLLQNNWILCPEVFWLQDDINIAPYGYGNTFVSNTFHQFCLTFQKPLKG